MDNSKKCKYCGTEIDKSAKICPNCKKRQKIAWWQVVLIVLAIIIVISALTSSDSPDNEQNNSNNENSNNVTTTENKEEKNEYAVGEVFNDGYMKVTYMNLNDNFTNYSQYATVKSGCKVVAATFEFENISSSDKLASSYDFNCYADGYDCDKFYSVDDSSFTATLSSGKKSKGTVYFEVPQDASEITIEYENNVWSSKKVIFRVK